MFVKLCGLRTLDDAKAAIEADASALGFILAESKRQVTPELVASVRDEVVSPPTIVGVTVNRSVSDLNLIFEDARLDMVQLSGDEPLEILDELEMPVIKALRFPEGTNINDATREVDSWLNHRHPAELVIIDGYKSGAYGGSGTKADWRLLHEVSVRYPIVLAGGLDPDNVAMAIHQVNPMGVDTSSGTETDGAKDPEKLKAFVKNAREAEVQY